MKQKLVTVNLAGVLGQEIGRSTWKLAIKSCAEAINAVEALSNHKLFKFLLAAQNQNIKYRILINGRDLLYDKDNPPHHENPSSIFNSELCAKTINLETIDIVPLIEGADNFFTDIFPILLGATLIISSFFAGPLGPVLFLAGAALVAAGVINLLTKPPELQEFKDRQKTSFLFSGPTNIGREGLPVPVGYGLLLIGSSIVSASYDIGYYSADDNSRIVE